MDEKEKEVRFWVVITLLCFGGIVIIFVGSVAGRISCNSKCHPQQGVKIEGTCHCATDTGWERLERG